MVKHFILIMIAAMVMMLVTVADHTVRAVEDKKLSAVDMTEEKENPSEASIVLADIFNSSIQITHLVFQAGFNFAFQLPEVDETKPRTSIKTPLTFTTQYKTLFRLIISPNAP
jgi:hypothetical protein